MYVHAPKTSDEFVGVIPTKGTDRIAVLIYNYIDPDIFKNYLSRNIALLKEGERRALLGIIKSDKLDKILRRQLDAGTLPVSNRVKTMLKKAQELNDSAARFSAAGRNIKIVLKNVKEDYVAERYTVDSACNSNCDLPAVELEQVASAGSTSISLVLNPYSVNLVVLTKRQKEALRPQEIDKALEEAAKQKEIQQEQPKEPEKPGASKPLAVEKQDIPKQDAGKPAAAEPMKPAAAQEAGAPAAAETAANK
jgi:hypothetical protein